MIAGCGTTTERSGLFIGRAIFHPRGRQHLQIVVASLVTFCWIAMMVVTALRFAERVMRILKSAGLHITF